MKMKSSVRREQKVKSNSNVGLFYLYDLLHLYSILPGNQGSVHKSVEQEKAIMQKNIVHLQDRVNYKQCESLSNISLLTQLERKHHEQLEQLCQFNPYLNTAGKKLLEKLNEEARMNQFSNSILELGKKFEAINYDFFRLLVEKVPDITRNEKVLCAYLEMNMSQAEIAELLQKSTNSVRVSFSRLREKFSVQTNPDLLQILNNLEMDEYFYCSFFRMLFKQKPVFQCFIQRCKVFVRSL